MATCRTLLLLIVPVLANAFHRRAASLALQKADGKVKRILLFWSVGSSVEVMDTVAENMRLARSVWAGSVDTCLVHYDLNQEAWHSRLGSEWYTTNVDISAQQRGYKFQLLRALTLSGSVRLSHYHWVWTLDEDVAFALPSLVKLLPVADRSGALIVTPAFTQPSGSVQYEVQLPNDQCLFRYTNFVEVLMPMLRSETLSLIFTSCDSCLHDTSVWGLDYVWCSWSERNTNLTVGTACAVIDAAPMQHLNFKTLLKYSQDGSPDEGWKRLAEADKYDVRIRHHNDFVPSEQDIRTLQCVSDSSSAADFPD